MRFHKYHALGNDYLVMDPADYPGWTAPTPEQIRVICHRNYGIGSDGILWGPLPATGGNFGLRILQPGCVRGGEVGQRHAHFRPLSLGSPVGEVRLPRHCHARRPGAGGNPRTAAG